MAEIQGHRSRRGSRRGEEAGRSSSDRRKSGQEHVGHGDGRELRRSRRFGHPEDGAGDAALEIRDASTANGEFKKAFRKNLEIL